MPFLRDRKDYYSSVYASVWGNEKGVWTVISQEQYILQQGEVRKTDPGGEERERTYKNKLMKQRLPYFLQQNEQMYETSHLNSGMVQQPLSQDREHTDIAIGTKDNDMDK